MLLAVAGIPKNENAYLRPLGHSHKRSVGYAPMAASIQRTFKNTRNIKKTATDITFAAVFFGLFFWYFFL